MAFPIDVLNDIARGKAYYADLNSQYIQKLNDGCSECTCVVKDYQCLKRILRSLDFKVELDEYDDIAKKLVDDMLLIIGNYVIPVRTIPIKYGYSDTPINPATFTYQFTQQVSEQSNQYTLLFPIEVLSADKYIAIEEPLDQPSKGFWFNTNFNRGNMGDFIINTPVTVGSNRAYLSTDIFVFDGTNRNLILSTNEL